MTTVPKDDFRPLPYLVALGAVGAATVGVFFGIMRPYRVDIVDRMPGFQRLSA